MPPHLALFLWLVLLIALLWFDPAKVAGTSPALWLPVIWMFIVGSRPLSLWFSGQVGAGLRVEEGNPVDRTADLVMILLALIVLASRSFKWGEFFARNIALVAFLSFALLSVIWSDFPFVALKRWFRDLGSYLMVVVALSDRRQLEAVRTLLRRLGYLLIPLSVLLVKYYPEIGRQYERWHGTAMYVGPTTGKNGLGVVCLVSGMFFFWDTMTRWSNRKERRTKRIIVVNVAFIATTVWLLNLADSATSRVCLGIGCAVIAFAHSRMFRRRPVFLTWLIPIFLCLYPIVAFGFGMNGELAAAAGRDPTLTTRTEIWDILLGMHTNPLVGTGYESFWLGSRLESVWSSDVGTINEAHNGYLEIYLNLGIVGLLLLSAFLIASYRIICMRLKPFSSIASLSLALWTVALFYNITEAAFKVHFMWVTLLIGTIAVPGRIKNRWSADLDAEEPFAISRSGIQTGRFGDGNGQEWWNQATIPPSCLARLES